MKKILFVIHAMGYGGAERALVNLLCELPEERFQVDLLCFQRRGDFLSQLPPWVNVLDTPPELKALYGPTKQAGRLMLRKIWGKAGAMLFRRTRKERIAWRWQHVFKQAVPVLQKHYDAAVAFTGSEIQYFIADCVDADKRVVFIHNDYRTAGYSAKDDEPYFAQMDRIVSISPRCVETLEEIFPQYRERMLCLENITSSTLVKQRALEFMPAEYPQDMPVILSVGRLNPQKGFDIAIDAAAILRSRGVKFRWFIVGEGPLKAELKKQINDRGLQEDFVLLGARNNPYPYMAACRVLVQSSRFEGKSVVLDEAKMLCVPIVATAYPTVADQLTDGQEGMVIALSADALADGVQTMLEDAALREKYTAFLAGCEYGNQHEAEKYIRLLEES